ncbi:MAG: hypothetical protein Q4G39_06505 [Brachymonas sp.]|nr:hypothetical protein [Brachymonas sp.]
MINQSSVEKAHVSQHTRLRQRFFGSIFFMKGAQLARLVSGCSIAAGALLFGGAAAADSCPPGRATSAASSPNETFWQEEQLPRDVRGSVIVHQQQEDCLPPSVVRRTLSKEELRELRRVVREQAKKQAVNGAMLRKENGKMP